MKFKLTKRVSSFIVLSALICSTGFRLGAVQSAPGMGSGITTTLGTIASSAGSAVTGFVGNCARATTTAALNGTCAVGSKLGSIAGNCTIAGLETLRPHANIVEWLYGMGNLAKNNKKETGVAIAFGALAVWLYCNHDLDYSLRYADFVSELNLSIANNSETAAKKVLDNASKFVSEPTIALLKNLYYAKHVSGIGMNISEMEENAQKAVMGPWWWYPRVMLRSWLPPFRKKYAWDVTSFKETLLNIKVSQATTTTQTTKTTTTQVG